MKQLIHFGAATASACVYAQINPVFVEFLLRLLWTLFGYPRLFYRCTESVEETDYAFWQFWWFASWLLAYSI
jgi:hypothetical protein